MFCQRGSVATLVPPNFITIQGASAESGAEVCKVTGVRCQIGGKNILPVLRCGKLIAMVPSEFSFGRPYCRPENKGSLGFVEGLNKKIRVIQRRVYGLNDEDYLRLKVLTCMLPEL